MDASRSVRGRTSRMGRMVGSSISFVGIRFEVGRFWRQSRRGGQDRLLAPGMAADDGLDRRDDGEPSLLLIEDGLGGSFFGGEFPKGTEVTGDRSGSAAASDGAEGRPGAV